MIEKHESNISGTLAVSVQKCFVHAHRFEYAGRTGPRNFEKTNRRSLCCKNVLAFPIGPW